MKFANAAAATVLLMMTHFATAQSVADPELKVETIVTDTRLAVATNMEMIAPNDFLVNTKQGKVWRVKDAVVMENPVLEITVGQAGEQGLLGMKLHPQFETNNLVYLFYTVPAPEHNRISRFTWNGTSLVNEEVIFELPAGPSPSHNAGIMAFGPPNLPPSEQKLFVVVGDLNRTGQTQNYQEGAAADGSGVIIRINADGSIPSGTDRGPFYDVAGDNEWLKVMYAYGIRNSFGMDFDPLSNALWDSENGDGGFDEINRVDPAFNSGWERVMGPVDVPPATLVQFGGTGTYSNPEFSWETSVAPTAIHFYRGGALGNSYKYDAFVGSTNTGKLYRFNLNMDRTELDLSGNLADAVLNTGESDESIVFGEEFGILTDIATGLDDHLYLLQFNWTDGTIYRISSTRTAARHWGLYE